MHVHGEAKYWLEPNIELARNYGLSNKDLDIVYRLIEVHQHDIRRAWREHFNS